MRRYLLGAALLMLNAAPAFSLSNEPYLSPAQVDAILLLPPPPPGG